MSDADQKHGAQPLNGSTNAATSKHATIAADMRANQVYGKGKPDDIERGQFIRELLEHKDFDYRNVTHIASGGFGHVFRADNQRLVRTEALKVMRKDSSDPKLIEEKFKDGPIVQAKSAIEGVPHIYGVHATETFVFCNMQYVDGEVLDEYAEKNDLSFSQRLELMVEVCDLVHRFQTVAGFAHRDLKPGNIIVNDSGRPWLVDFDLAKDLKRPNTYNTCVDVGTPGYMAPEQKTDLPITLKTDVYPLGIMVYEVLTGSYRRKKFFSNVELKEVDELRIFLLEEMEMRCPEQERSFLERIAAILAPAMSSSANKRPRVEELRDDLRSLAGESVVRASCSEASTDENGACHLDTTVFGGSGKRGPAPSVRNIDKRSSTGKKPTIALFIVVLAVAIYAGISKFSQLNVSIPPKRMKPTHSVEKSTSKENSHTSNISTAKDKRVSEGNKDITEQKKIVSPKAVPPPEAAHKPVPTVNANPLERKLRRESKRIEAELKSNPLMSGKGALLFELPENTTLSIRKEGKILSTIDSRLQSGGTIYKNTGEVYDITLTDANGTEIKTFEWRAENGVVKIFDLKK
ncbi:MAG: serine/threonine protein kinase [Kiritimatiellaeota bacterium]|nr:serine/threonine protein kinase [Kiritimatiellota bacterium]